MNKKLIIGIIVAIAVVAIGVLGFFLFGKVNNNEEKQEANNNIPTNGENDESNNINISSNGKILVVYYSASGSTKKVAEEISLNLDADLFEIEPVDIYTSEDLNWTNDNSRVSREHNDESLRDVELTTTKVDNWEEYDTILIGYPIWWGIAAWPVEAFVKSNDFTGKTVIPFCTSSSSGLGQSGKLLEQEAKGGKWLEGHRFSSVASSADIKNWIDSLK